MAKIIFKINGVEQEIDGKFGPDVSLNEYIRNVSDLRGTKAMCHEGGCGACVVSVRASHPPGGEMKVFSVNSCLVSVLSCHGWEITTVEGVGNRTKGYHAVQTRLARFNGTQCGYCTPGWIAHMYSILESKPKLTIKEIENSFAGNMCRCTGYRPIADAFKTFATDVDEELKKKLVDLEDLDLDVLKPCGVRCREECSKNCDKSKQTEDKGENWCVIGKTDDKLIVIDCGTHKWFKAYNLKDVFAAMKEGDYKLIAGNTGQGVYHVTTYPKNVIDIFDVTELKGYVLDVNLILGGGMTLAEMMEIFKNLSKTNQDFSYLAEFYEHMDLVAHMPVRNIGTIAGNLFLKHYNKEFQSDLFLIFETVGAMVTIAEAVDISKTVSLNDFLKTDMKRKVILNVMLPPLSHCCFVKTYKIMPRSQNAHAVVNAGFLFKFGNDSKLLTAATIVYGSISPTFVHAAQTEKLLVGKDPFTDETLQLALKSLMKEIDPVESIPEPSAAYRKMLAVTLYYKAILFLCPDDKINPKYRSGGQVIKRGTSQGTQTFDTDKSLWPLNQPIPKLEALVQCSGEATFANDLPKQMNEVFAAFVTADACPGSLIAGFDIVEAFKLPGVKAFYSAKDIPGKNNFIPRNPLFLPESEEILCSKKVLFYGQPAGIIVADREKTANLAAKLVKIKYESVANTKPMLTIDDVMKSKSKERVKHDAVVEPKDKGNNLKCVVYGEMKLGSQYHYYMEPQTCVVRPTEDGMEVYSSTQWLDLTNIAVAQCLNIPQNRINVIVRRVGGAYGGKISRATLVACAASIVSYLEGKTCRFIMNMQTNVKVIGKRASTDCKFEVGINNAGEIQYLRNVFYQDAGCCSNETLSTLTLNHFHNCYDSKRWYIEANSVLTDTPSTTWCRSPASTEGIAMIEYIMEKIAFHIKKDPIEVRLANIKSKDKETFIDMIDQLKKDANYEDRLKDIQKFNENNRWRKRSLKMLTMNFDLMYFGNYNCIISVYHGDGSVVITHGGIEMGQGINTKVAQVCAHKLKIPLEKISIKPSASFTSPNSTVTGGSIGSECVSLACLKACEILNKRLKPIREKFPTVTWEQLVEQAYMAEISLQAAYMYSSRDGLKPYDIYGVIALEVEVDILTGNHDVRRVDLLEDVGQSLSPEIDVTQIEGALVMGLGYWTSEKLVYDPSNGNLLTDRTWTYKPPGIKDIPADFRIYFKRNSSNENGVLQSKATGEPALCLATAVVHALREAVRAARMDAGYEDQWLDIPPTSWLGLDEEGGGLRVLAHASKDLCPVLSSIGRRQRCRAP